MLDKSLNVTVMQYLVESGKQVVGLEVERLEAGTGFKVSETKVEHSAVSAGSTVKYDLLGEIAEKTQLTRRNCAAILTGINPARSRGSSRTPSNSLPRLPGAGNWGIDGDTDGRVAWATLGG